jgi:hypothetical protein
MNIDLSPLVQSLILGAAGMVTLVFAAVGLALRQWITKKTGLTDAQLTEANSAIYNIRVLKGISYAESVLGIDASKLKPADIANFVNTAAEYIKENWPETLKEHSLSEDDVAKHVIARLPSETSIRADAAQHSTTAATVPVVVKSAAGKS